MSRPGASCAITMPEVGGPPRSTLRGGPRGERAPWYSWLAAAPREASQSSRGASSMIRCVSVTARQCASSRSLHRGSRACWASWARSRYHRSVLRGYSGGAGTSHTGVRSPKRRANMRLVISSPHPGTRRTRAEDHAVRGRRRMRERSGGVGRTGWLPCRCAPVRSRPIRWPRRCLRWVMWQGSCGRA